MSLNVQTELSQAGSLGWEDPYEFEVIIDDIKFTIVEGEHIDFEFPFKDVYIHDLLNDGKDVCLVDKDTIEEIVVDHIWELFDEGEFSPGIIYTGLLSGNVLVYVLDLPRMAIGHEFDAEIEIDVPSTDTWNFVYFKEPN